MACSGGKEVREMFLFPCISDNQPLVGQAARCYEFGFANNPNVIRGVFLVTGRLVSENEYSHDVWFYIPL